jgi:hypothetical protein
MTQSNQITPARPLQARKRTGAHLALVHDSGAEVAFPAPYTADWARRLARAAGMSPAETWRFVSWICSFREHFAPPRSDFRVVR